MKTNKPNVQRYADMGCPEQICYVDIDAYDTSCGNAFIVGEGTPAENDMKFCCYCGGDLKEVIDHDRRIKGEDG